MSSPRSRAASSAPQSPTPPPSPPETTSPELEGPAVNMFGPMPAEMPVPPSPDPGPSSYSSPSDPSDELGPDFGSGPRSTAEAAASGDWRKRRRELKPVVATAVETAGGIANAVLTAEDSLERQADLYLPDPDDVEAIAEPLAGLASRRVPAGPENPDVADLIGLAFGLVGYVVKQLRKRAAIKAAQLPPAPVDHTPDDEQQQ